MASAVESHPLGVPMLEGYNNKIVIKANSYYQKIGKAGEGIFITRYKYILSTSCEINCVSTEKGVMDLAIQKGFATHCEVCGTPLFRIEDENGKDKVRIKKQIILIDNLSRKHYICYKAQSCYKKAGIFTDFTTLTSPSDNKDHIMTKFVLPSLRELLNSIDYYRNDLSEEKREYFYNEIEASYNDHIKSFMRKWISSEINKNNMVNFIFGFDKVKDTAVLIRDSKLQNDFIVRIFEVIGIDEIKGRNFVKEQL